MNVLPYGISFETNEKRIFFERNAGGGLCNVGARPNGGGLFAKNCVFVHMGGSWGKKADVYGTAVNTFGNTAIVLNDIDLAAVVGGKEVVNPFMVTEVYVKENNTWKMGSLTFSHLARPVRSAAATPQPAPQR